MQELSLVDIAIIFVVGGLLFFLLNPRRKQKERLDYDQIGREIKQYEQRNKTK